MPQDVEKIIQDGREVVREVSGSDFTDHDSILNEFTPAETKKVIHRVDRRLVSTLGIIYCISLIVRLNMGNANVAGMRDDLDLAVGTRYSTVSLVFYPTFIIFQIPVVPTIRYVGPRLYLTGALTTFGALIVGGGFVTTWTEMVAVRVLLGMLEAGVLPGSMYLLSTWYQRYAVHKRLSTFYFIGEMASAFGSMLALGLMQMKGLAGLNGWRWIFIIEGLMAITIATCSYFLIVGFPDEPKLFWRFLSERETRLMRARVDADRGDAKTSPFNLRKYLHVATDLKLWAFAVLFCLTASVTNSLNYFLPIILREGMGYTVAQSQYLSAPPYLLAGLWCLATAALGDRFRLRSPILLFNALLQLAGVAAMGWGPSPAARYAGVCLTCVGAKANVPTMMAWQANNVRGQWKRAFCSGLLVSFGGVGGIVGSSVFRHGDAPLYRPGLYACFACAGLAGLVAVGLAAWFGRENRRAERGECVIEGEEERGFRYTL